jgi:DNA-binding transcriptional LysR family regulator
MGRTQSAITQQIQKLEQLIGKPLFDDTRRTLELTEAGTIFLSHAKQILRQQDECMAQLAPKMIEEKIVLGVPDLYAAFILPPILSAFRRDYPRIRIELCCALSRPLVARVKEGSVDVALVTRMNGFTGGQVVGREQLIWLTGATSSAHFEDPCRWRCSHPATSIEITLSKRSTGRAATGMLLASATVSVDFTRRRSAELPLRC